MPEISEMSLGGNFGVAVRVRPGDASLKSCVKINGNTVSVADERHGLKGDKSFAFDRVFDGSTKQEEVFAEVAATVDAVPDGVHIPRPSPFTHRLTPSLLQSQDITAAFLRTVPRALVRPHLVPIPA
jgi:hypothetical protein